MEKIEIDLESTYVHELFEQQVERTPHRIALVHKDCHLTYQELNQRSNQLAVHLTQLGVRPETIVGIYLEDPIHSVLGILGVLKAGGAYTPLNIDDPRSRIFTNLENAQVQHIIVDSYSSADFKFLDGQIIDLDKDIWQMNLVPKENLGVDIHHKNLAYVIHTSGTTGKPKSVAMSHDAFSNLISWHTKSLGGDNVRTLLYTPFSFDASNQELFSTICAGGILYLIDNAIRHDPFQLIPFIQEKKIGRILLFFAPLQSFMVIANAQELVFNHLREIITAGEPIKMTSQLLKFFQRNHTCRFVNMYGLSETHTVTCFIFPSNPHSWPTTASIGFPISHTKTVLLNEENKDLETEQSGEIYVSGISLARGYLNRPDLTAEKYLPFPFGRLMGERMCRTGDLGKRLPDGSLECLGRRDHQVKIRGYRVELNEVESVLTRHTSVNEAVVIARGQGFNQNIPSQISGEDASSPHLIAYLVVHPQREVTIQTLRTHLQEHLPPYMIPSIFVFLEKLPLSTNGKVARNLLPNPIDRDIADKQENDGPRNPVEEVVLGLWTNGLGLENFGIHTNFFELGGESLAATRLISEIRKLFQCELGVRTLFENPTVAKFAQELAKVSMGEQYIHDTAKLILQVAELSEEEVNNSIISQR